MNGNLVYPSFVKDLGDVNPVKPSLSEILRELVTATNFVRYPQHALVAFFFVYNFSLTFVLAAYFYWFFSMVSFVFMLLATVFLGTVYNTVWYHRYCSHAAFKFGKSWARALFLWTNPFVIKEETYAIPHRIHHQLTDKSGDPYGPHLGWLASFLSSELTQRISTEISEKEYTSLTRSIQHIGLQTNTYARFKRTGSIEGMRRYLLRVGVSQLLWACPIFLLGGIEYLFAWYAANCMILCLVREFNWRGHGGENKRPKIVGWEFDNRSYALNQWFYGYLASEWHDNHHKYPYSANNGFLPGQIDLAFLLIRLMRKLGWVESYEDAQAKFESEFRGPSTLARA